MLPLPLMSLNPLARKPSAGRAPRREAKARTADTQQGDADFLEAACRFLPACAEVQARQAPEKCAPAVQGRAHWHGLSWEPHAALYLPAQACCGYVRTSSSSQIVSTQAVPALPCAAVVALCRAVKAHAVALGAPKRGVAPLRCAVAKLCPSTDHLSPVHADLFQL